MNRSMDSTNLPLVSILSPEVLGCLRFGQTILAPVFEPWLEFTCHLLGGFCRITVVQMITAVAERGVWQQRMEIEKVGSLTVHRPPDLLD